jgi:hypothetical protein
MRHLYNTENVRSLKLPGSEIRVSRYPCLIVLVLNNPALQSPAYSRTALVTNKITGGDKSGRVHDYVAFKGD